MYKNKISLNQNSRVLLCVFLRYPISGRLLFQDFFYLKLPSSKKHIYIYGTYCFVLLCISERFILFSLLNVCVEKIPNNEHFRHTTSLNSMFSTALILFKLRSSVELL